MTDTDQRAPKPRRGKTQRTCARAGCSQPAHSDSKSNRRFCSYWCVRLAAEYQSTEQICRAVGAPDLWAALVAAADAWTAYADELAKVRDAALEVGVTDEQWAAIRHRA